MFVGREIGLWVMGIEELVFFGLFDECILRAFFLAFNMKNFGYFRFEGMFNVFKFFIKVLWATYSECS